MPQSVVVVDAFTDRPFTGNPAAVCVMAAPAADGWMQAVAREMNLAETAFLHPAPGRGSGSFALRWFTPTVEVDLCGHATLASAHVLWTEGHLPDRRTATFETRSGQLRAEPAPEGRITLDFPATPAEPVEPPPALLGGVGAKPRWIGRSRFDYLVELDNEGEVRGLVPDLVALASLGVRGVIVTSQATPGAGYHFVSRFFAPGAGIPEDPVTGSAHCTLAPYWEARLGRSQLTGFQASARGGTVEVQRAGDRVLLTGRAVTTLRGMLVE
jgi:predicted PhzF superfamily epimerase YddE/YHI9